MPRLPIPGQDKDTWGDILNEYLGVSLDDDGALRSGTVTVSKIAADTAPTVGQVLTFNGTGLSWTTVSGSGSVPDASSGVKGVVQLTGDLGGTASAPTVPGLATKADVSHQHATTDITSGVFTVDRLPITSETTAGVVELATIAEVEAGTDTTRAVTPAGVKAAIDAAVESAPAVGNVVFVDRLSDLPVGTPVDTLVVVRAI